MTLQLNLTKPLKKLCTLTRGTIVSESVPIRQLKEILDDPLGQAEIERLVEFGEGRDYGRIFYRVIFRTNCSINVHSLGFWGPQDEGVADYHATIKISELSSLCVAKQKLTFVTQFSRIVTAKRRQLFFVRLDEPVHVQVGKWTQVEFSLNGPPTAQCDQVWCDCEGDEGVKFNFVNSSHQLPVIQFEILRNSHL